MVEPSQAIGIDPLSTATATELWGPSIDGEESTTPSGPDTESV